ncbi:HAMP domain-containing histidine kinase [Macrococcus capreoli]|uniref:HAMP domain-containing sensor histidine kinase n=1 Tax=Macrococcus capreoli TaxID=2982690 RepID=UPI0021D5E89F|nr:HAMP domain-containing histidine kinase [Macrococcus sp. TMW 2.2395]MCU7556701.1 HAMP domain-containing histidine kinase [Macrococcus sp. TMW 2.2395]
MTTKSQSLRSKWTILTTTITFIIFMLFSLFIIFLMSTYQKEQEVDVLKKTVSDISALFEEKTPGEVTTSDIKRSMNDNEKVFLYDIDGKNYYSATTKLSYTFELPVDKGNKVTIVQKEIDGTHFLLMSTPLHNDHFNGYLTVAHSLDKYFSVIQFLILLCSFFGLTALFITALISFLFSNQITKPIRQLSSKMNQIKRDGFQNKLQVSTSYNEMDDMIDTFNEMMSQLETSFDQQKQFVEDASHELRTPLQIVNGHLNLIQRWGKNNPDVLEESLSISLEEMNRINKLVEELLLLSKDSNLLELKQTELIDINSEIRGRIHSIQQLKNDYTFEYHSTHDQIKLNINRFHFEQILLIFLDNAMKYDQRNKHIVIRTSLKNKLVQIEIIDNGEGIPQEDIQNVFDRFYRVDKSRARSKGGNGLGLSIAKKLIESYKGQVRIESEVDHYTKVIIQFPIRTI